MKIATILLLAASIAGADEVDDLLRDLASDDYATRQAAHQALVERGPEILDRVRAAASGGDPEVAGRVKLVIEEIETVTDEASNGLACRVWIDPPKLRLGESGTLHVAIRNTTRETLLVDLDEARTPFRLGRVGENDEIEAFRWVGGSGIGIGNGKSLDPIAPGETIRIGFPLEALSGVRGGGGAPGLRTAGHAVDAAFGTNRLVYRLQVEETRRMRGQPLPWHGRIEREATLEVER